MRCVNLSLAWRYMKIGAFTIIIILGIISTFKYLFNFIQFIDYKMDLSSNYKYEQRRINEESTDAYILGRVNGLHAAEGFDADRDTDNKLNVEELQRIAADYYEKGEHANTPEEIRQSYGLEFASSEMPVLAYRSGYIDAFVDYILMYDED